MFTEDNTTEKLIIDTLKKNGWKYIPPETLPRRQEDVLVESMVKDALIRLNPVIAEEPSRADLVIYKLRSLINTAQAHDLIKNNEEFKKLIFEQNTFNFGENGRAVSIKFFGTGTEQNKNEYVVTNQYVYPYEVGGKRLDLVLLINGIPLVIGELKTPVRESISWIDAAEDLLDYQKSIPEMFVTNVFTFASDGKKYRYGAINAPLEHWGPWYTPKQKEENKLEGTLSNIQQSIKDMLKPEIILDLFQYFTLFATDKKYRKYKIITRYQQYEGANAIVNRVLKGYPKKGLIWHFQGSGKSLLMVFAALKLRQIPELKNPTVVIVDDRIDLETQITATFNATEIPNLQGIETKENLIKYFKGDMRKILITTIYKFGETEGILNERDNIILMVDEAHRTQEGNLGLKMRTALPNAFFFGLTGTPINKLDKNTFKTFGADEDRGGYMSKYSFSDSIRDGATLELHFEAVPSNLHVAQDVIDQLFDDLTKNLTEKERSELIKRVKIEAIMKDTDRIAEVCKHIARHYKEHIQPNGFKGQVVCYDRECCLLYKKELDKYFDEDETTVVINTNDDKAGKYKQFARDRDQEGRLLDEFRDAGNKLKLVIVTSKLLTGFDAPILQVMYLDKPMKDHTLLQAICRTNRTYGMGKTFGLIVDYIGIFDNIGKALEFDEKNVEKIITNLESVKSEFPRLMNKCLAYFPGVNRRKIDWEGLMEAQEKLPSNTVRDQFGADYRVLNRVWNGISPDPMLHPYKADYIWLTQVYESIKPVSGNGGLIWATLGQKTIELIHKNIFVDSINETLETLVLNPELIEAYLKSGEDIGKKTKKIEIELIAKIRKHSSDPKFLKLGERLEELRERHAQGLITSIEFLHKLLELAKDTVEAEKEVVPEEEIDKGKAALTELFNGVKNQETPIIVEKVVNDIDDVVRQVRYANWKLQETGQKQVRQAILKIIWIKYKIKDKNLIDKAYEYVAEYY